MKKALLFSALALAALAPARAAKVTLQTGKYPVPVERRVPWTIISGTEATNEQYGKTGGIADLIDRNPLTYWHTGYDTGVACDANAIGHNHWFLIDRGIGADKVPFDMLSIQQRVTTNDTWNGAVTEADIYVTDEYIGLLGGPTNKDADDAAINYFRQNNPVPTTRIELDVLTQEAQLFNFDSKKPQTGRFILVVITHTINPNFNNPDDKFASLAEFNLFAPDTYVTNPVDFEAPYSVGENPENTVKDSKRTVSLTFSDSFTKYVRYSPMLQSNEEPYITYLNWLDWKKTYFDITSLMTISVADDHNIQINATGNGSGMYKALYVDFNDDEEGEAGFNANDLILATESAGNVAGLFEAKLDVNVDDYSRTFRARYIVDSEPITSPTPREGIGAAGGIVVDFLITMEQEVNFNIVYTYNGAEVSRIENQKGYANEPFTVATPDFFDIDANFVAPDPDNEEFSGMTQPFDIEVPLTRIVLPFAYTTLEEGQNVADIWDSLQWQAVNQHTEPGTGAHYIWSVDVNGTNAAQMVGSRPDDFESEGFDDEQLWAYVGDIANGFKIYNKAFDASKCVYIEGGSVKFGEPGDNPSIWFPSKAHSKNTETGAITNQATKTYCAFSTDGTNYINLNTGNASVLGTWTEADQGSTCWFSPAGSYMNALAQHIINTNEKFGRCVGATSNNKDNHEALVQAAVEIVANPASLQAATTIKESLDLTSLDENQWYRLANVGRGEGFLATNATSNSIGGNNKNPKPNYHTIVKFVPVKENTYNIYSQGLYFGTAIHDEENHDVPVTQVDENGNKGEYVIAPVSRSVFTITDTSETTSTTDKRALHESGGHNIVVWDNASTTTASHWYLVLADDIEMSLPETKIPGLGNAGFGFFPFPVSSADEGTKLYTIEPTTNTESGAAVVTYKEVASVPAETAFIAANEELSTVTLQIGAASAPKQAPALYADAAAPAKFADGTFRAKDAEVGDYVLDNTGDVLSFKKTTAAANVAGNYVYLPAANVTAEADELPFNDPKETTTDIREINVEQSAAAVKAVYDLQGRRLAAPAKGINIINGKKVLVK